MTLEEFTHRLEENRSNADAHAAAILSEGPDSRHLALHLREYVRCKYFLEPDDMTTEDIILLGNRGTERLADLRRSGLEFRDTSAGCTSVSSAVAKKALLILSLGKALGVSFDPDQVAEAATLSDIASLLQALLKEKSSI